MTQSLKNFPEDDFMVKVKAQVMTRDDSTGCWNPIRGGLSVVGLRRQCARADRDVPQLEYLIQGQRITDKIEVLNCVLTKDVRYTTANPTFVHWKIEGRNFGLTFTSSHDAKAFDRGMKRAFEDMLEDYPDDKENMQFEEDDVFMPLDLPLRRNDSSSISISTTSTTTSSPSPQSPALPNIQEALHTIQNGSSAVFSHPHANHHHLHKVHYIPCADRISLRPVSPHNFGRGKGNNTKSKSSDLTSESDIWIKAENIKHHGSGEDLRFGDIELDSSYVQFNAPSHAHDYSYPDIDIIKSKASLPLRQQSPLSERKDSVTSMKRQNRVFLSPNNIPQLPLKNKKRKDIFKKDKKQSCHLLGAKIQCKYCKEMFSNEDNPKGSCEDAPDYTKNCMEAMSCLCSARSVLFHCMADEEHNYDQPCICDSSDDNNCKKWTVISLLSLLIPCLWCYWPLMACHKCGVSCGCCGGRHKEL